MSSMMNVARADLNDTTMLERRYLLQRLLHSNRQSLGFGPCNGQERQIGIVPVMAEFEVKPPPFALAAGIHHPVGKKRSSSRGGRASSRKSQSGGAGGGTANNGDDDFQLPLLLHTRDEAVLSREEWRSFLDLGRRFEISPAMRKTILSGGRGNNSARFSRSSSSKHKPPPGGAAALVDQLQRYSVFGGGGGAGSGTSAPPAPLYSGPRASHLNNADPRSSRGPSRRGTDDFYLGQFSRQTSIATTNGESALAVPGGSSSFGSDTDVNGAPPLSRDESFPFPWNREGFVKKLASVSERRTSGGEHQEDENQTIGAYDQQEVTKTKSGRIVAERARINSVEIDDYDATTGGTAAPLTSSRVAPDESDRSPFTVTKLPSILKNGNGERLGLYPLETKRISLGAGGQESIPLGENDNIKTLLGLEPLPTLEQRARSSLKENAPSEEVALETPPVAEADHAGTTASDAAAGQHQSGASAAAAGDGVATLTTLDSTAAERCTALDVSAGAKTATASRNMFSFPAYGGDHQADGFTRSGQLRRKTISAASELERSFDSDFLPGGGGAASFTGVPFGSFDIEKTTAFSGASASTPASLRKARISVDRIDEAEDEEKAASSGSPGTLAEQSAHRYHLQHQPADGTGVGDEHQPPACAGKNAGFIAERDPSGSCGPGSTLTPAATSPMKLRASGASPGSMIPRAGRGLQRSATVEAGVGVSQASPSFRSSHLGMGGAALSSLTSSSLKRRVTGLTGAAAPAAISSGGSAVVLAGTGSPPHVKGSATTSMSGDVVGAGDGVCSPRVVRKTPSRSQTMSQLRKKVTLDLDDHDEVLIPLASSRLSTNDADDKQLLLLGSSSSKNRSPSGAGMTAGTPEKKGMARSSTSPVDSSAEVGAGPRARNSIATPIDHGDADASSISAPQTQTGLQQVDASVASAAGSRAVGSGTTASPQQAGAAQSQTSKSTSSASGTGSTGLRRFTRTQFHPPIPIHQPPISASVSTKPVRRASLVRDAGGRISFVTAADLRRGDQHQHHQHYGGNKVVGSTFTSSREGAASSGGDHHSHHGTGSESMPLTSFRRGSIFKGVRKIEDLKLGDRGIPLIQKAKRFSIEEASHFKGLDVGVLPTGVAMGSPGVVETENEDENVDGTSGIGGQEKGGSGTADASQKSSEVGAEREANVDDTSRKTNSKGRGLREDTSPTPVDASMELQNTNSAKQNAAREDDAGVVMQSLLQSVYETSCELLFPGCSHAVAAGARRRHEDQDNDATEAAVPGATSAPATFVAGEGVASSTAEPTTSAIRSSALATSGGARNKKPTDHAVDALARPRRSSLKSGVLVSRRLSVTLKDDPEVEKFTVVPLDEADSSDTPGTSGRSTQQRSGEKHEKRLSSSRQKDDDEDEHQAGDQHGGNLPFDKRATGQDYPEDLDEDRDFCGDVEERRDETGLISLEMNKPGPDTSSASTSSKSSLPAEVELQPPPHINDPDKGKRLSRNLRKRLLQVVQERAPFLNLDDRKTTFFGRRSTERGVNPRDLGEMFHVRYFTFVMHFPESKLYIDRLAWHHERKGKMLSEADLENVFDEVQHSLTGLLLGYTTDALSTVQKRNAAAVEHVRGDRAMDFMMEVGLYPLVDEEEKILRDTLHKYLRANHLNSTTTQPNNSGDHRGAGGCGGGTTAPSTASSSGGGANNNKPQLLVQAAAAISKKGPLPFEVLRKIQLQPSDVVNVIRETLESFQAIYDDQKAKVIEDYELERTVIPTFYTVTKQSQEVGGGGGGTNSNSCSSPGPAAGVEKGSQTSPAVGAAPGSPQNLQQQNINNNKGNHLHQVEDETHMLRDLLELYKAFCQMDSRKCGVLSGKQLDELSRTVFGENRAGKQKYLHNVTQVTFCDFLRLVHKRRLDDLEDMKMDLWRMTPQRVFYPPEEDLSDLQIRKPGRQTLDVGAIEKHQKLHSHTLTQADVCRMLARLEIFPKSTAEQLQIQEILELVFPTANDVLSFEQFQYLCKKIQNLLNFKYAESELNYVHQFFTPRQISAFRKHFERLTADNGGGGGLAFDAAGSSGSSASCGGGAPAASLVAGGGGPGGAAYYSIADTARIPLAQVRNFLLVSYKITIEPPELWKFLEEEVLLCASSRGANGNGDGSLDGGNIDPLSARRMSIKRKSVHDMTAAVLANMKETLLVTTTTPGPGAAGAADTTASPVLGSGASSSVPGAGSSMTGAAGGSSKNGAAPENGDADFAVLSITQHDSTTPAGNQGMAGVAAFNPTYVMSTSDGGHAMVQFGATEEIESAPVPVKPTKSKREPVIFVGPSDIAPSAAAAAAGATAGAPGGGGGIMGAAAPSASGASGTSPGSISPGRAALGGKGYVGLTICRTTTRDAAGGASAASTSSSASGPASLSTSTAHNSNSGTRDIGAGLGSTAAAVGTSGGSNTATAGTTTTVAVAATTASAAAPGMNANVNKRRQTLRTKQADVNPLAVEYGRAARITSGFGMNQRGEFTLPILQQIGLSFDQFVVVVHWALTVKRPTKKQK